MMPLLLAAGSVAVETALARAAGRVATVPTLHFARCRGGVALLPVDPRTAGAGRCAERSAERGNRRRHATLAEGLCRLSVAGSGER
jgi:hypothetical protein